MKLFDKLTLLIFSAQSMIYGKEWNTVYLASFPRSGNHWVRFLVEEATHIATSSVYKDKDFPHLGEMFPWGAYSTDHGYNGNCRYPVGNEPVLIKTHFPVLQRKIQPDPKFAICLVRHPIDALWSYNIYAKKFNNSYNKEIELSKLEKNQVKQFVEKWKMFYDFWIEQPDVLFVRYEDLYMDTAYWLNLILQKAGYSFNQIDVERAIFKYLPQGKPLKHISHYDADSIEMIKTELSDLLSRFNYEI
jgi:hypothetical protein